MAAIDRISVGQKTLTSTATLIVSARKDREGVELTKLGQRDAYLGCANVTTTNGHLFAGDCGTTRIYPTTDAIYGVVASGDLVITYLEIFPA